jgi:hypothetical protein
MPIFTNPFLPVMVDYISKRNVTIEALTVLRQMVGMAEKSSEYKEKLSQYLSTDWRCSTVFLRDELLAFFKPERASSYEDKLLFDNVFMEIDSATSKAYISSKYFTDLSNTEVNSDCQAIIDAFVYDCEYVHPGGYIPTRNGLMAMFLGKDNFSVVKKS